MDLNHRTDGSLQVVLFNLWSVEDLHGEQPPRDVHQRGVVEVLLELLGIQSGTHDNELQVFTLRQDLFHQTEENISGQCAFVGLIEDKNAVPAQRRVKHRLSQQHTVRHVLEKSVRPRHILETDGVPTCSPSCTSISVATRVATLMAATLRGCVQATPLSGAMCTRNWGICVVFPEPVSPTRMTTWYSSTSFRKSSCASHTGSCLRFFRISKYLAEYGRFVKGLTVASPSSFTPEFSSVFAFFFSLPMSRSSRGLRVLISFFPAAPPL
eukprot:Sspe_Gene.712::Locus_244_Transcript_1_1_Confidence_1.000_Length_2262::g.712::m.712